MAYKLGDDLQKYYEFEKFNYDELIVFINKKFNTQRGDELNILFPFLTQYLKITRDECLKNNGRDVVVKLKNISAIVEEHNKNFKIVNISNLEAVLSLYETLRKNLIHSVNVKTVVLCNKYFHPDYTINRKEANGGINLKEDVSILQNNIAIITNKVIDVYNKNNPEDKILFSDIKMKKCKRK